MLVPVLAMAAVVGATPASAAEGNGWSCISPFASYTNGAYASDPPALDNILDSLAITVARTDATPLTAVTGQKLALTDLQLGLTFTDLRVAEQMYRRTGGATSSYSQLIPYTQTTNDLRNLSVRTNPADGASYWSYGSGQNITYVQKQTVAGEPPKVRDAATTPNTTWYYATPTLGLGHRYISHTGNSQFPLDAWVTIAASNTVEGVQTLPVKGYWTINIKDATPGTPGNPANYNNDAVTVTVPPVSLNLPSSRWTPTGAGPVEFTIAAPGKLGVIQVESKGYDRTGYNTPLNVRPFGSVYVRAQTEAYGASNDCIPGQVSILDKSGPSTQGNFLFGDADPVNPDPALGDPATPGAYATQNGQGKAVGVRGRFKLDFVSLPPIATAALPPVPVPVPAPAPKPATFAKATSLKASKAGSVKLALTNPNTAALSYKLSAKTVGKYKVGKSKTKKVVTVATSKTVSLKPGASNVSFSLSKTAKSLLSARKSLKVKVTLTPASGGSALTKTITLKRS
ncbi:hypothetical protein [Solirubrobacter pauli]|nr:hypothetical protein [Solirubrobacter pauli]